MKAQSQTALPQSFALPFPASPAIMADVVAEQVADQNPVMNGEAEEREEADPVEETGKKKRKKKKKSKAASTGEEDSCSFLLTG